MMLKHIKAFARKLAVKSPYLWGLAWKCLNTFSFLLPHDNGYLALKHFCTSENDLFLDIGANTGISALTFRKISKNTPILSIEPNSLHEPVLAKLVKKIPPFSFLILGVGNSNENITLYTPIYKNIILHTFTSASKEQIYYAVQKSFGKKVSSRLNIEKIHTKIVKIDDLNINPTIIKIDTEAYDYPVILGATATLLKMRPYFMIEACWASYQEMVIFFKEHQYGLLNYDQNNDNFIQVDIEQLNDKGEGKNIFAVPLEKMSQIPVCL